MTQLKLKGEFNVIVVSNSRLTVHLEGDVSAWQRRLKIIAYEKPKPATVIPRLDKQILQSEASGVSNWMLDGLNSSAWRTGSLICRQTSRSELTNCCLKAIR